jgi:hypothetical protein
LTSRILGEWLSRLADGGHLAQANLAGSTAEGAPMSGRFIAAMALIVIGIAGLAYGGLSFTHKEDVVDLGPIKVSTDKRETLPVPPIVGGIFIVAGVALLVTGRRQSA